MPSTIFSAQRGILCKNIPPCSLHIEQIIFRQVIKYLNEFSTQIEFIWRGSSSLRVILLIWNWKLIVVGSCNFLLAQQSADNERICQKAVREMCLLEKFLVGENELPNSKTFEHFCNYSSVCFETRDETFISEKWYLTHQSPLSLNCSNKFLCWQKSEESSNQLE